MDTNIYRMGSADNIEFSHSMTTGETLTMYFALRAYRDQLIEEVLRSPNRIKQYKPQEGLPPMVTEDHSRNKRYDAKDDEWYLMDADIALKGDINYEDLTFFHETLANINKMLFDLMDNHDQTTKEWIQRTLAVD